MMEVAAPPPLARVDLGTLGFDRGAHLLVNRALSQLAAGESLEVIGRAPHLEIHLRAWCRQRGHPLQAGERLIVRRGHADLDRWCGAERAGRASSDGAQRRARPTWGLAARGARVESGAPEFRFGLDQKEAIWTDSASALYRQALAGQWDPEIAIPWEAPRDHPAEIEDALVQVLTYLIENETAALLVPARFASQTHPHFREILQLLAIQAADEARHIEVFSRRALLDREELGLSTVGGQTSLKTLVDEPDFTIASFLLSVLGEGSFLNLLSFLRRHAPDLCTAEIMRLTSADEARHVAFGMSHLAEHAAADTALLARLAQSIERRHAALQHTAGLNEEVFDGLVILAAGGWETARIATGYDAVNELVAEMDQGRRSRLRKLGFAREEAEALSALHTRNFM